MSDLDTALRSMLRERAQDVTSVPSAVLDAAASDTTVVDGEFEILDVAPVRLHPRGRTYALLAGAAAVAVAVAVGVLVAVRGGHDRRAPTLSTETVRGCTVQPTAAWNRAVRNSRVTLRYAGQLGISGIDDRGRVVVSYVDPRTNDSRWALLGPHATAIRSSVSVPVRHGFLSSFTGGRYEVIGYSPDGSGGSFADLAQVDLLDLRSGQVIEVPTWSHHLAGNGAFVQDGQFYYQLLAGSKLHRREEIVDFDIATGTQHVVARAGVTADFNLDAGAIGVWWNEDEPFLDRPANVPAVVAHQMRGHDIGNLQPGGVVRTSFVTDGTAWAWQTPAGDVMWWQPGSAHVVRITGLLRKYLTSNTDADEPGFVVAVAGEHVVIQPPSGSSNVRDEIVDVRTGVAVPTSPDLTVGSHGLLYGAGALPHFIRHPLQNGTLYRLDAADLPDLRC